MKKQFLIILSLTIAIICNAQNITKKYFNDEYLGKEVPEAKAKFLETIIQNADGSVTTEVKNIKTDKVFSSQTYKGDEPFGEWIYYSKGIETEKLDYNFNLNYIDTICKDSIAGSQIEDYFQDNDNLKYKAPKISTGEKSIIQFIAYHLIYPQKALDEDITGRVILMFTITKEGTVENISIKRGTNILLDKEAVRVLRLLKFSNPATLNGTAQSFCLNLPVTFKLQ